MRFCTSDSYAAWQSSKIKGIKFASDPDGNFGMICKSLFLLLFLVFRIIMLIVNILLIFGLTIFLCFVIMELILLNLMAVLPIT